MGFQVIVATLPSLIDELQSVWAGRGIGNFTPVSQSAGPPSGSPYKLLHYYDVGDASLFFGREDEIERLTNMIRACPLVVVTGASGAGKTSLLNAGVSSRLAQNPPFEGLYVRFRDDPWRSLEDALRDRVGKPNEPGKPDDRSIIQSLIDISRAEEIVPVVVFDQFEELFVRFPKIVQENFWSTIRSCLMNSELPIRFVVVIRNDYLGQLAGMRQQYPDILQNTFYVSSLSSAKAQEAMIKPADRVGVLFDADVAVRVAHDLQQRSSVSAPELQIVCDALFNARIDNEITTTVYEALGGAAQILATFMNRELARRDAEFQTVATKVLKALVTSEETKENLPLSVIARRAKLSIAELRPVLVALKDECRFLRSLPGDEEAFELSHDYLAREISAWMTESEKESRAAHDLLDRELRAWAQFGSIRLGPDRLKYFREHLDEGELNQHALLYLMLSSVRHLEPVDRWVDGVKRLGSQDEVARKLFDFFEAADLMTRREAAEAIGLLDPSCIVESIASTNLSRRSAAIEMVGGLRYAPAIEALLARALDVSEHEVCRILAVGALSEFVAEDEELAEHLIRLAWNEPNESIRCAAIVGVGRARNSRESYLVVQAALDSEVPDRRDAGLAAISQGEPNGLLGHFLKRSVYDTLDELTQNALWSQILRLPWKSGGALVQAHMKELSRSELLRYDRTQWGSHWLYKLLVSEFCRRFPDECHKVPDRSAKIKTALASFDWSMSATKELIRLGFDDDLIVMLWGGVVWKPALGEYVRDLVESPDLSLRVFGLRVTCRGSKGAETIRHVRRYVASAKVRNGLQARDSRERYWACLAAGYLEYKENAEILREMCDDDGKSIPYDEAIGIEVRDAAKSVLDRLAPGSAIWRRDWQLSFRTDGDGKP
ncbi:MAG: hypothetical protein EON59_01320 [Alphaproteobacteria bacterium]|nr:MAG: hypothetical protein EON59_01320 [Alphaproteobacteria bacterium]